MGTNEITKNVLIQFTGQPRFVKDCLLRNKKAFDNYKKMAKEREINLNFYFKFDLWNRTRGRAIRFEGVDFDHHDITLVNTTNIKDDILSIYPEADVMFHNTTMCDDFIRDELSDILYYQGNLLEKCNFHLSFSQSLCKYIAVNRKPIDTIPICDHIILTRTDILFNESTPVLVKCLSELNDQSDLNKILYTPYGFFESGVGFKPDDRLFMCNLDTIQYVYSDWKSIIQEFIIDQYNKGRTSLHYNQHEIALNFLSKLTYSDGSKILVYPMPDDYRKVITLTRSGGDLTKISFDELSRRKN